MSCSSEEDHEILFTSPFQGRAKESRGDGKTSLLPAPLRRPLVEEGVESLAEIAAHVTHQNQILALLARQPPRQPHQSLLGGVKRQWRMAGDQRRELIGALLQRRQILDDFVE
jgi:hypothetical protein